MGWACHPLTSRWVKHKVSQMVPSQPGAAGWSVRSHSSTSFMQQCCHHGSRSGRFICLAFGCKQTPPTNCGGRPAFILSGWSSWHCILVVSWWQQHMSIQQHPPGSNISMDPVAGVVEQACTSGSCGRHVQQECGHLIIRVVAVEWHVLVCVCVPVKPTRGNTT